MSLRTLTEDENGGISLHPQSQFSKEITKVTKLGGFETRPYFLRPMRSFGYAQDKPLRFNSSLLSSGSSWLRLCRIALSAAMSVNPHALN